MKRSRWPLFMLGLAAVVLMAACAGTAQPRGWAPPTEEGEIVFVAHRSRLYAYDAADFQPLWIFPSSTGDSDVKTTALYGAPLVASDVAYIPTYNKRIYAIEAATGELVWPQPFRAGDSLVGGVASNGQLVYFGSSDGTVYALNSETGAQEWEFTTDAQVWSTPVIDGSTLYVTSLDGRLYALDANTGDELWSFKTDGGVAATPVVSAEDGLVLVAGFDGRLRAVDIETQEQAWSRGAGNWFWATPLLKNGVVYAASLDHKVYAVNASSGEDFWAEPYEADAEIRAAPVLAGDRLIVVDRDGHVHALDPQDGSRASETLDLGADVNADPLTLSTGEVLLVTTGGEMIRINPETLTLVSRVRLGS